MDLSEILNDKPVELVQEVEFKPGIFLKLRFVPRSKTGEIGKASIVAKYDRGVRERERQLDVEMFTRKFLTEAVQGWRGVTPRSLAQITPEIDVSKIPADKLDTEVTFSTESLMRLVKQNYELDKFIQDYCVSLENFRPDFEGEVKNSVTSQSGS